MIEHLFSSVLKIIAIPVRDRCGIRVNQFVDLILRPDPGRKNRPRNSEEKRQKPELQSGKLTNW
jgi:hypothetical protein